MQGIFISYRRQDSQSAAGRLADDLKEVIVDVPVFRDVETIAPGVDFVEAINRALQSCGVLLAVIGPRWLSAVDGAGQRRLDNPDDYTRLEIATALKRGDVRVIPVLVEGALMPAPGDLPADLQALARRNAVELSDNRWSYDVSRLAATVCEALGVELGTSRKWQQRGLVMAAGALAVAGLAYLMWPDPAPTAPAVSAMPSPTTASGSTATAPASSEGAINLPTPAIPANPPVRIITALAPPNSARVGPCPARISINRNLPTPFSCRCDSAAMQEGYVWGSDFYTDDSHLCRAAVHVGVIPASGGVVTVLREPGRAIYPGSYRNGIQSTDYGAHSDSMRFVGAPPVAPGPERCPAQLGINRNLPTPFKCRCDAAAMPDGYVWGSDVYTDDSRLCRAALHAGVITPSGGVVTVVREPGSPIYVGSRRNGVESLDYGAHSDSIRFVRRVGGGRLTLHPDSLQPRPAPVLRPLPDVLRSQPR